MAKSHPSNETKSDDSSIFQYYYETNLRGHKQPRTYILIKAGMTLDEFLKKASAAEMDDKIISWHKVEDAGSFRCLPICFEKEEGSKDFVGNLRNLIARNLQEQLELNPEIYWISVPDAGYNQIIDNTYHDFFEPNPKNIRAAIKEEIENQPRELSNLSTYTLHITGSLQNKFFTNLRQFHEREITPPNTSLVNTMPPRVLQQHKITDIAASFFEKFYKGLSIIHSDCTQRDITQVHNLRLTINLDNNITTQEYRSFFELLKRSRDGLQYVPKPEKYSVNIEKDNKGVLDLCRDESGKSVTIMFSGVKTEDLKPSGQLKKKLFDYLASSRDPNMICR